MENDYRQWDLQESELLSRLHRFRTLGHLCLLDIDIQLQSNINQLICIQI